MHGPLRVPGFTVGRQLGDATSPNWLAVHDASGAEVTLRVVSGPAMAVRARLLAAIDVLRELDHPHVLRYRDMVERPDDIVIVLEAADGGSLSDLIRARGTLPPGELVTACAPIAEGLAEMHQHGIVHGAVTAHDVVFAADGRPMLAGVGLGVLGVWPPPGATSVAPETVVSAPAEPAADVYSLAYVACVALSGYQPRQPLAIPGVPGSALGVLSRCLMHAPEHRPDAGILANAIYGIAAPEPVDLVPEQVEATSTLPRVSTDPDAEPPESQTGVVPEVGSDADIESFMRGGRRARRPGSRRDATTSPEAPADPDTTVTRPIATPGMGAAAGPAAGAAIAGGHGAGYSGPGSAAPVEAFDPGAGDPGATGGFPAASGPAGAGPAGTAMSAPTDLSTDTGSLHGTTTDGALNAVPAPEQARGSGGAGSTATGRRRGQTRSGGGGSGSGGDGRSAGRARAGDGGKGRAESSRNLDLAKVAIGLVFVLLVVAGVIVGRQIFGGDDELPEAGSPGQGETVEPTDLCGGPQPAPSEAPPAVTDWAQEVQRLYELRTRAFAELDATLLCDVYAPTSESLARDVELLQQYSDAEVHPEGLAFEVIDVTLVAENAGTVTVEITDQITEYGLVKADGEVRETVDAVPADTWQADLVAVAGPDGGPPTWRFS